MAGLPPADGSKRCFCRRSNVGQKSSLINALTGRKGWHARRTRRPGRKHRNQIFLLYGPSHYIWSIGGAMGYANAPVAIVAEMAETAEAIPVRSPDLPRAFVLINSRQTVSTASTKDHVADGQLCTGRFQVVMTKVDKTQGPRNATLCWIKVRSALVKHPAPFRDHPDLLETRRGDRTLRRHGSPRWSDASRRIFPFCLKYPGGVRKAGAAAPSVALHQTCWLAIQPRFRWR